MAAGAKIDRLRLTGEVADLSDPKAALDGTYRAYGLDGTLTLTAELKGFSIGAAALSANGSGQRDRGEPAYRPRYRLDPRLDKPPGTRSRALFPGRRNAARRGYRL